MVAVPLCGRRRVIGVLEAFSSEPFGFNDSDVGSLELFAELILAALKPEDEDRFAESARIAEAKLTQAAPPVSDSPSQKASIAATAITPLAAILPDVPNTAAKPISTQVISKTEAESSPRPLAPELQLQEILAHSEPSPRRHKGMLFALVALVVAALAACISAHAIEWRGWRVGSHTAARGL